MAAALGQPYEGARYGRNTPAYRYYCARPDRTQARWDHAATARVVELTPGRASASPAHPSSGQTAAIRRQAAADRAC